MKKVLFASTALMTFAGAASADITLSGFAEMGIAKASGDLQTLSGAAVTSFAPTSLGAASARSTFSYADGTTGFHTDINVNFTMSGETDGGLVFGASVDLEDKIAGGDATGDDAEHGGVSMFISGAFGTLTAGDTDGALDWALTEVIFNGGSINDASEHGAYNGNSGLDGLFDGQIFRYEYAIGDVAFALSAELDDSAYYTNDDVLGIGFKYSANLGGTDVALGLGYQTSSLEDDVNGFFATDVDALGFSANASFANGLTAGLSYVKYGNQLVGAGAIPGLLETFTAASQTDGKWVVKGKDTTHIGVGVGYTSGAYSASFNYGKYDAEDYNLEIDGYGLALGYDLGGGASVQFGYGTSTIEDTVNGVDLDRDSMSLGLRMNF